MKEIPNKIYIDEDLINYHCLTYRCDGDLEYIRKDVLLNWLKERHYCPKCKEEIYDRKDD